MDYNLLLIDLNINIFLFGIGIIFNGFCMLSIYSDFYSIYCDIFLLSFDFRYLLSFLSLPEQAIDLSTIVSPSSDFTIT